MDALRAPFVLLAEAKPVPVCSESCRERFQAGERLRPSRLAAAPSAHPPARPRAAARLGELEFPLSPIALSIAALLVAPFSTGRWGALATLALVALGSVDVALRSLRSAAPRAPLPLAAAGVVLVGLGAYARFPESGSFGLIGATLACVAVAARFTLWVVHQEPLEREAEALAETLAEHLPKERAEAQARALREEVASSARIATRSAQIGVAVVLAVAAALLFFPPKSGSALAHIGAVFLSLPLLAPIATTARAHLLVGLRAADRGIYFDGPRAIERFGQIGHAIFPMHGTLTHPTAELVEVRILKDEPIDEDELLALVASAQAAAGTHPIALACRGACRRRGLEIPIARRARALEGRGVVSLAATGEEVVVGHRALLLAEGVSVARADRAASEIEANGDTAVFVAVSGRVRGVLAFRYPVREGAAATVERLKDLDVDITLLSGDHRETAESLARELGIPHVRAELLPSEKLAELARIQENAEPVVVIEHAEATTSLLPAAKLGVHLKGTESLRSVGAVTRDDDPRLAGEAIALAKRLRRSMIASGTVVAVCGLPTLTLAALFDLSPALTALIPLCVEAFTHPTGTRAL